MSLTNFEMVKEFHTVFGKPDPVELTIPDGKLQRLRLDLIIEEVKEVAEEFGITLYTNLLQNPNPPEVNLAKVGKELADLLYFTYGAAANFGIDLDAVFAEVHRSNMTKLGDDGKPILREDGKILKGPNYQPADIEKVLYGPKQ